MLESTIFSYRWLPVASPISNNSLAPRQQKLMGPCESLRANYNTHDKSESHTWAAEVRGSIESMSSLASCITFPVALHGAASRTVRVATYNSCIVSLHVIDVIFWAHKIPNLFFSLIRNCFSSKLDSQWLHPLINLAPCTHQTVGKKVP